MKNTSATLFSTFLLERSVDCDVLESKSAIPVSSAVFSSAESEVFSLPEAFTTRTESPATTGCEYSPSFKLKAVWKKFSFEESPAIDVISSGRFPRSEISS